MKRVVHDYSEFGKRTKIIMVSLNLSSKDLAKMLGYKESTLCDVLKGRNRSDWRMKEIDALLFRMQKKDEIHLIPEKGKCCEEGNHP